MASPIHEPRDRYVDVLLPGLFRIRVNCVSGDVLSVARPQQYMVRVGTG